MQKIEPYNEMVKEIASTNTRLFNHWDRLTEIQETKKIRPITVHLAPTNRCNLDCSFCSTRLRENEEIPLQDMMEIVDIYERLGVKSFELTGGGDPTIYSSSKHPMRLEKLIFYIKDKGLGLGMITNGLRLEKIEETALKSLDWMRISLAGLEINKDDEYMHLDPSRFPTITGSSIVASQGNLPNNEIFHESMIKLDVESQFVSNVEDQMARAMKVVDHLGLKYLRVVPNCYNLDEIEWGRKHIPKMLSQYPKSTFTQAKNTTTPKKCYWKYMKPFVNADGYVYQCSTNSLFTQHFSPHWRIGHWKEIEEIYNRPVESFDTSACPYCFYGDQNNVLTDVLEAESMDEIITKYQPNFNSKVITPSFV